MAHCGDAISLSLRKGWLVGKLVLHHGVMRRKTRTKTTEELGRTRRDFQLYGVFRLNTLKQIRTGTLRRTQRCGLKTNTPHIPASLVFQIVRFFMGQGQRGCACIRVVVVRLHQEGFENFFNRFCFVMGHDPGLTADGAALLRVGPAFAAVTVHR